MSVAFEPHKTRCTQQDDSHSIMVCLLEADIQAA